jgi:hypothetical protein
MSSPLKGKEMIDEQEYARGSVAFLDAADCLVSVSKNKALLDDGKPRAHAANPSSGEAGRVYSAVEEN